MGSHMAGATGQFDAAQSLADYRMLGVILGLIGYPKRRIAKMDYWARLADVMFYTDILDELNRARLAAKSDA